MSCPSSIPASHPVAAGIDSALLQQGRGPSWKPELLRAPEEGRATPSPLCSSSGGEHGDDSAPALPADKSTTSLAELLFVRMFHTKVATFSSPRATPPSSVAFRPPSRYVKAHQAGFIAVHQIPPLLQQRDASTNRWNLPGWPARALRGCCWRCCCSAVHPFTPLRCSSFHAAPGEPSTTEKLLHRLKQALLTKV